MTPHNLYGKAGLKNLGRDVEFLGRCGLFPEVYLPGELLDSLGEGAVRTLERWREDGKEITFHAPFVDLSPGGFDPRVLDVTRFRFSQVMDLAGKVGPRQIVFHPGFDGFRFSFREDLWLENSRRVWGELLESAEKTGTRVCLENVFDTRPDHLALLRERLGPELGFCLDTGHLLLFSEVPLPAWLDAFSDGLIELHLHDNDSTQDLHLPVGEGSFDFGELHRQVRSRKLEPLVVLEHHTEEETIRSLANYTDMVQGAERAP